MCYIAQFLALLFLSFCKLLKTAFESFSFWTSGVFPVQFFVAQKATFKTCECVSVFVFFFFTAVSTWSCEPLSGIGFFFKYYLPSSCSCKDLTNIIITICNRTRKCFSIGNGLFITLPQPTQIFDRIKARHGVKSTRRPSSRADLLVTVRAFLLDVITVGVGTRDFGCWQLVNEMFY